MVGYFGTKYTFETQWSSKSKELHFNINVLKF